MLFHIVLYIICERSREYTGDAAAAPIPILDWLVSFPKTSRYRIVVIAVVFFFPNEYLPQSAQEEVA